MLLHLVIIFKLILVKKRVSILAAQQSIRYRTPILNLRYSHPIFTNKCIGLSFCYHKINTLGNY
jgi:hypothetical protein